MMIRFLLPAALLGLLAACSAGPGSQVIYSGKPETVTEPAEPVSPPPEVDPYVRARILADILYEARLAYEDNRLLSPSGNNAFDHYREALSLDPGNEVALEGIQDIVLRYIELADNAIRQRQFSEADSLLARAASINADRPELEAARQRLDAARQVKVERFALDAGQVSERSLQVMTELAEIAMQIMREDATFLIHARTDAEGRWIYKVMRESVGGFRLRGNIDINAQPGVTVNHRSDTGQG